MTTWAGLCAHVAGCQLTGCECKIMRDNFARWRQVPELLVAPCICWLVWDFTSDGRLSWQCQVCMEYEQATKLRPPHCVHTACRLSSFKRHAKTNYHEDAVAFIHGKSPQQVIDDAKRQAPPLSFFKELLRIFQTGVAPSGGYVLSGGTVVGPAKSKLLKQTA